jgi:NADPH-dependent curcumin reductase CurA
VITKTMLDQLRAERIRKNAQPEYAIGGPIRARVVSALEAERERKIKHGEHVLQNALDNMRREQAFASHDGLVRVHFNHTQKGVEP